MLRKMACIAASAACAVFLSSAAVFSEGETSGENANLLDNYKEMPWTGNQLHYDAYSSAVYFENIGSDEPQSAVLTLDVKNETTGFMFRTDAGNGAREGSGFCTVTFYDKEHNSLFGLSTGVISGVENYTRFSIGKETQYYPIPEGAKTVEIVLSAEGKGDADKVHMYFRNFALYFSGEKPLLPADGNELYMEAATGLSRVEIGIRPFDRYLWIGIVFLVAMSFFIIGVWRQKYKTPTVMKGTDRRGR